MHRNLVLFSLLWCCLLPSVTWDLVEKDDIEIPNVFFTIHCNNGDEIVISGHTDDNLFHDIFGDVHGSLDKAARVSCDESAKIELINDQG